MQILIYNIIVRLYGLSIHLAAIVNPKARAWVRGRKHWKEKLRARCEGERTWIWIHCASLGEFEQGRPLIEAIRTTWPQYRILLSFFSPSGYEIRKNYDQVDAVAYLPLDTPANAAYFVKTLQPVAAIFIKYELWYNYLNELSANNVNTLHVSAIFRSGHPLTKWYGGVYRNMLKKIDRVCVQDVDSVSVLKENGITGNVEVTGDTRYDRVMEISARSERIPRIERFAGEAKLLIAGSTWTADEKLLKECFPELPSEWKLIIAPHEVHSAHLASLKQVFDEDLVFFSQLETSDTAYTKRVLVIDNIGMLSGLYRYGAFAYIGGGFGKGIHNILEPAAHGLPVVFGPIHEKFLEAIELKKSGYAFSVSNVGEFKSVINRLTNNDQYLKLKDGIAKFMLSRTGATQKIMEYMEKQITV